MTASAEWELVCIKNVCEAVVDCVNKTAPTVEYETSYKMIRTSNVKSGWIDLDSVKFVEADVFVKWNRRTTPKVGDVILTREAPLGEVGMIRTSDRVFLGQRLMLYRADPKKLDNRFLLAAFQSDFLQGQIKSLGSGATVEHMRVPDAEKLMLRLPTIAVQRRIGDILSAYDDLIENNTRRIKILEQMAQMLYREWFVNFSFPGHEKVKMVESEMGLIPEGWPVWNIGELFEFHIGGGWGEDTKDGEFTCPAHVIRGTDIPPARTGNLDGCPLRYHKKSNLASRILEPWDIVFEVSGGSKGQPVGRALLVHPKILSALGRDVMCASFCKLLRPKTSRVGVTHLYQYLLEIYSNGIIEKYQVQSTGITNFKFAVFLEDAKLAVPTEDIRGEFEQLCRPILDSVSVLGCKNENLRKTRDLLLPKLVSGEISVEHLEKEPIPELV
jgi:type I restriction enzyme S subunit